MRLILCSNLVISVLSRFIDHFSSEMVNLAERGRTKAQLCDSEKFLYGCCIGLGYLLDRVTFPTKTPVLILCKFVFVDGVSFRSKSENYQEQKADGYFGDN